MMSGTAAPRPRGTATPDLLAELCRGIAFLAPCLLLTNACAGPDADTSVLPSSPTVFDTAAVPAVFWTHAAIDASPRFVLEVSNELVLPPLPAGDSGTTRVTDAVILPGGGVALVVNRPRTRGAVVFCDSTDAPGRLFMPPANDSAAFPSVDVSYIASGHGLIAVGPLPGFSEEPRGHVAVRISAYP